MIFFFRFFFDNKNTPKLMILEVPLPREHYRTLRDIEMLLPILLASAGLGSDNFGLRVPKIG